MRYLRWLQEQHFDHPAHQIALQEMVEAVRTARERCSGSKRLSPNSCRTGHSLRSCALSRLCVVSISSPR